MENKIKNYGFVPSEIKDDHYVFGGALPKISLQPNKDWTPFIPLFEGQAINFETYGCTVFGTVRAVVTLMKRIYGNDFNFSERFYYILAKITPPGSDPHLIAELWRKNGAVNQDVLPMTQTLEEFRKPDPLTLDIVQKGQDWLSDYGLAHDWVFTNDPSKESRIALLSEALEYGTVCISVTAWYKKDGLYIDNGQPNTHWVHLIRIDYENGEGILVVNDSYDMIVNGVGTEQIKRLHPDHHVQMAKRYAINSVLTEEKRKGFLEILKNLWNILFNLKNQLSTVQKPIVNQTESKPTPDLVTIEPVNVNKLEKPKYDWSTPELARHSFRVICDEEHLDVSEKNLLCAVIMAESGFKNSAKHENKNAKGVVTSTDWGICQINDYYHVAVNGSRDFTSVDDIVNNPDKATRFMIACFKNGNIGLWSAYKNGSYKKYL